MKKMKVAIQIKNDLTNFLASVNYMGRIYGGGSPCKTEKEITEAVASAKRTIQSEGDTFIVEDLRIKQKGLMEMIEI
jgi:hypothetical protein